MAAGSGTRMGAGMPKQFLELDGKAVLQKTMEVFLQACPGISVVTVLPEDFIGYWKEYCLKNNFICPQILVKGGITRFHSVRNALARIPDGALAAVHDGVRPMITPSKVRELFDLAEDRAGVIPAVPCVDTMKVLKPSDLKDVWEETGDEACFLVLRLLRSFNLKFSSRHMSRHMIRHLLTMLQSFRDMEKASPM